VACPTCGERTAVSLRPLPADGAREREEFLCPACSEPFGEALPSAELGFLIERRGVPRGSEPWPPTMDADETGPEPEGGDPGAEQDLPAGST
jgi:hypothetical protein